MPDCWRSHSINRCNPVPLCWAWHSATLLPSRSSTQTECFSVPQSIPTKNRKDWLIDFPHSHKVSAAAANVIPVLALGGANSPQDFHHGPLAGAQLLSRHSRSMQG